MATVGVKFPNLCFVLQPFLVFIGPRGLECHGFMGNFVVFFFFHKSGIQRMENETLRKEQINKNIAFRTGFGGNGCLIPFRAVILRQLGEEGAPCAHFPIFHIYLPSVVDTFKFPSPELYWAELSKIVYVVISVV